MKTVDLIPFILLELADGEKYGIELTKEIETKSHGLIEIKQPTLYTILKKLEKSKFIASFWQDSDIGGKRHYYKLTPNGRLQASTLPPYNVLLNNLENLNEDDIAEPATPVQPTKAPEKEISFLDLLDTAPAETTLPTKDIFENSNIDNKTTLEINTENLDCIKTNQENHQIDFAENKDVSKFVITSNAYLNNNVTINSDPENEKNDEFEEYSLPDPANQQNEIEYKQYHDFKHDRQYILAKKYTRVICGKAILFGAGIMILSALFLYLTKYWHANPVSYVVFALTFAFGVLYSCLTISKKDIINEEFEDKLPILNFKLRFFISMGVVLSAVVISVLASVKFGQSTLVDIFNIDNFLNTFAIIVLSIFAYLDLLFLYIFDKKIKAKDNLGEK